MAAADSCYRIAQPCWPALQWTSGGWVLETVVGSLIVLLRKVFAYNACWR